MSVSDDIGNLFQRFGGNPDRYQEVARDDDAKHAASRWPLLSALDIAQPEQVPGAGRPAPATSAKQAPDFKPAAEAPAANALAASSAEHDAVTGDPATSGSPRSPLFARSHRHAMMPPPVDAARQAASRFSPPPPQASIVASGTEAAPAAPAASAVDAGSAKEATRAVSREPQPNLFANRKQTFAPAPILAAAAIERTPMQIGQPAHALAQSQQQTQPQVQPQTQPQPEPQPQRQPQPPTRPAPQSPAPRSILSSLFTAPPVLEPQPSPPPAARDLTTVFARLAAAPHRNDRSADKKPDGERA
jgi:hypothetical protein